MLEIRNVSKSYDGEKRACDQVNLEVRDGEILGLLGPNGAGKTTLLKMVTGILEPDGGSITVNGFDISKEDLEAKKSFAFVPDDPNIFPRLKGDEYLRFMATIYNVPLQLRHERVERLAKEFEMESALADRLQTYSHGMRQKIMLMGALIHEPPLWILDEPMTGLDPRASFLLKRMMRQHADQGRAVLFSTHVLEVAEKVCDRVAIIDKGRVVFCGNLEELRAQRADAAGDTSLESLFLNLLGEGQDGAFLEGLRHENLDELNAEELNGGPHA